MFLTGLKVIRTRKRISRAKLSRDTGISIEDIKFLESSDIKDTKYHKMLEVLHKYLKVDIYELIDVNFNWNTFHKYYDDMIIHFPEGISEKVVNQIFYSIFISKTPLDTSAKWKSLFNNFKEEIEALNPKAQKDWRDFIQELEFNVSPSPDDYYEPNEPFPLSENVINNVLKDARVCSLMYKEFRNNGLSLDECLNLLKLVFFRES